MHAAYIPRGGGCAWRCECCTLVRAHGGYTASLRARAGVVLREESRDRESSRPPVCTIVRVGMYLAAAGAEIYRVYGGRAQSMVEKGGVRPQVKYVADSEI